MIAQGMHVRIRRSGTSVPVERLEIGDLIYDPVCDNYLELADLLSRESGLLDHALVRIGAGQLGPDRPRRDLLVSPQQPVAVTGRRRSASTSDELRLATAWQIGTRLRQPTRFYLAIPERAGFACVEGAVLHLQDWAQLFGTATQGNDGAGLLPDRPAGAGRGQGAQTGGGA